jgi:deazaflavin-dependent oxidoreductase (nitroreductase family)
MPKRNRLWKILKYPPQILYALGLGPIYGRLVLLLTTMGRKSGLERITPLQYDEIDGKIMIGSARGTSADWYRNILANPNVKVRVKSRQFEGTAEAISDIEQVADYLEYKLAKRPRMVGMIMKFEGFPDQPTRKDFEAYAANRAMVIISPKIPDNS